MHTMHSDDCMSMKNAGTFLLVPVERFANSIKNNETWTVSGIIQNRKTKVKKRKGSQLRRDLIFASCFKTNKQ